MATLTKKDLIQAISVQENCSVQQATSFFDTFISLMKDNLLDKKEIRIVGFGKFQVKKRKERVGRNPNTGDVINIPESESVTFTLSQSFSKEVKNK